MNFEYLNISVAQKLTELPFSLLRPCISPISYYVIQLYVRDLKKWRTLGSLLRLPQVNLQKTLWVTLLVLL